MYQLRLFRLLLLPSLFSFTVTILVSVVIVSYFGWQFIQDNQFFYDYLFGAYGLQASIWQHPASVSMWAEGFLNNSSTYFIIIGALALVAGVICYAILQAIKLSWQRTTELSEELRSARAGVKDDLLTELVTRTAIRIMAVFGWGLYGAVFSGIIIQFVFLMVEIGIKQIQNGSAVDGALLGFLAVGILTMALHVHIIFLRLCLLRPRIFGGEAQTEEIAIDSHAL